MGSKRFNIEERPDLTKLKGKSALVTGGASGIGAGIAGALARCGVFVTIADIDTTLGEELASQLRSEGHRAQFVQTDVTSFESQAAAFKTHVATSPDNSIDIVIPSAGLVEHDFSQTAKPMLNAVEPPEPPMGTLTVNTIGPYLTAHLACWYFAKAAASRPADLPVQDKHLLLMGSVSAYLITPMSADYLMSKHAVRGLFKSIRDGTAVEFGAGSRVNMLAPAYIETPMTAAFVHFVRQMGLNVGTVQEVVEDALRLCCDEKLKGRAVVTATGNKSFDVCDDREDMEGAIEMRRAFEAGVFAPGTVADPEFDIHLRYPKA